MFVSLMFYLFFMSSTTTMDSGRSSWYSGDKHGLQSALRTGSNLQVNNPFYTQTKQRTATLFACARCGLCRQAAGFRQHPCRERPKDITPFHFNKAVHGEATAKRFAKSEQLRTRRTTARLMKQRKSIPKIGCICNKIRRDRGEKYKGYIGVNQFINGKCSKGSSAE